MKSKQLLKDYLVALDKYREDPNRTHKDWLFEAEYAAREKLGMPTDHLEALYRGQR